LSDGLRSFPILKKKWFSFSFGLTFWEKGVWYSLWVLALFLFTSFSLSALHHVFLLGTLGSLLWHALQKNDRSWFVQGEIISYLRWIMGFPGSFWSLFLLIIFSCLSLVGVDLPLGEKLKLVFKLKYFVLGLISIFLFRELLLRQSNEARLQNAKILIRISLFSTVIATLAGLVAMKWGFHFLRWKGPCHVSRNCGSYGMYMTYGYGLSLYVTLYVGYIFYYWKDWYHKSSKSLWIHLSALSVLLLGLFLSYCRGAYLGFLGALPFFYFQHQGYRLRKILMILLGCLLSFGAIFWVNIKYVPEGTLAQLFIHPQRIESNEQRFALYQAVEKSFWEHPLLGLGYRQFEPQSSEIKKRFALPYPDFAGHAHNNFLEHLASTGLLGFLALLLFHLAWFWESWKRQDIFAYMAVPFIVNLFISGQSQYTLGDGENLFLIMTFYALSQVSDKRYDFSRHSCEKSL
jgi:O-antigen ligase